jgi:hypothetical protein
MATGASAGLVAGSNPPGRNTTSDDTAIAAASAAGANDRPIFARLNGRLRSCS